MKLGLYSIYDKKVGYMIPSFVQNDELAIRNFELDITSEEARAIKIHPENFNLQKVGEYDTDTGIITTLPIKVLVDAGTFVRKE